jgi:hypothetical protein
MLAACTARQDTSTSSSASESPPEVTAIPTEAGQDITGQASLFGYLRSWHGLGVRDDCDGYDEYGVHEGTQIIVRDENDSIIGTATFGPGKVDSPYCTFPFEFSDVPPASFYTFEWGDVKTQALSRSELEDRDWHLDFTLGE